MRRIGNEAVVTCNSTIRLHVMVHYLRMYHYENLVMKLW